MVFNFMKAKTDLVMILRRQQNRFSFCTFLAASSQHVTHTYFVLWWVCESKLEERQEKTNEKNAINDTFTLQHGSICGIGDGKYMRRNFMTFNALISLHNLLSVDGKLLVGIDDDAEESGICLSAELS